MEQKRVLNKNIIYLLSCLIPLAVMTGSMIFYNVGPFGDKSFIIVDGLHQYMPFFSVLYDKLKTGDTFFYSFRTGLGVNFLSLFSYYLSSPLNLFILLFKRSQLNTAVSLLLVFKIAISGLTAGIYFYHRSESPDLSVVAAACLYALNSYMTGYSWNVMWLDAIMVFPLIVLGIERLAEEGDGRLYCIALFYALYGNYYIAYMICIFSVLWFLICPFRNFRQFFLRGLLFAFYSFLAAGMAAFLLIPAYMGIRQTASGGAMALPAHGWLTGFVDLLNRQFDLAMPISHDNFDGNINLFFGISSLFTMLLYLFNREIRWSDKIKRILLLAFLYLSFNETILNFIWHGFHDQYGIPNRFSFLFGFILLEMLVVLLDHRGAVSNWQPVLASAAGTGLVYVCWQFAKEPLVEAVYCAAGALFVFYGTLFLLMTMDRHRKIWYVRIFSLAAIIEMGVSAVIGYGSIGQISVSKFFSGTDEMEKIIDTLADGSFYRAEVAEAKFVDESSWHRLNGISLFGSTAMENTVNIMDNLGFYTGCNEYLYKGGTPLTNLMLNVRYLFFRPGDTLKTDFQYKEEFDTFSVYENPVQNTSIGYVINRAIMGWNYRSAYPFRVLNDFCIQGYQTDRLFHTFEIEDPVTEGCRVENTNAGEYHFFYESSKDDNLLFSIPVPKTVKDMYLFYDGTQVENVRIAVDDRQILTGDKDGIMLYAGRIEGGSTVTVKMRLKGEKKDGYIRLSAAAFDRPGFEKLARGMTQKAFRVKSISSGSVEGEAETEEEEMLFFSIPYDQGWTVRVDGKKTSPAAVGNAFLAVKTGKGKHKISLKYSPPGFSAGWKISLFSFLLFIILWIYQTRNRRDDS